MSEYKETLNLPKTSFPMKANLAKREPQLLKQWQTKNIYKSLRVRRKKQPKFILHDGPPYANGDIHMGHAVNKVLKDIVVKSKSLADYDAPYIPGWDCHGLPIELNVEKKVGKPDQKLSETKFRQACADYAQSQRVKQSESFQRLGVLGEWGNPYLTLDKLYEADVVRGLAKIIENGHLKRGFKPVHWCVDCCSALAEAEVEYRDKESPAIDVRFLVCDIENFLSKFLTLKEKPLKNVFVPIWTTTPWTLPANQAVAVNPMLDYVLVECVIDGDSQYFLVVESLLQTVLTRYQIEKSRIIGQTSGQLLEGIELNHPFYDRKVPIVLGDHVTIEAGTGAVHTAPGHGVDDYLIGVKYQLPIENPVDAKGCFVEGTPLFANEFVYKANDHIIEVLKGRGALIHAEKITHSYPCCWRHKTPLIFRATPQWFIDLDQAGLREKALEAIAKVNWLPSWGQSAITDMVIKRPDWCISRQRVWGVPITLFVHQETEELHPETVLLVNKIADRIEKEGLDAWYQLDPKEFLGEEANDYRKVMDTLDVWFDSGMSHACVLDRRLELNFPADIYLEGNDQYRGWFQSSLLTACAIKGKAPYKTVITHGFTVDAAGYKMSKSQGNVVVPEKIMKTLGADVLRLWIASIDYRAEIAVSDEILNRTVDVYRRIRNTARFLLANLNEFNPKKDLVSVDKMVALDRWAINRAHVLQQEIKQAYDHYQFHLVYQKIHHFCSLDMGSFYLDVIKDRQYTTKSNGLPRRSAQTTMYYILECLVRWIAPILSFTADEIWEFMPGDRDESVFYETWYEKMPVFSKKDTMNESFWETVLTVRNAVNKNIESLRGQNILGSALEANVTLYVDHQLQKTLEQLGDELRFVLITSEAKLESIQKTPDDAVLTELTGLKLKIVVSPDKKCVRCWHRRPDVGKNSKHPELCLRCVENIDGKGEVRKFA